MAHQSHPFFMNPATSLTPSDLDSRLLLAAPATPHQPIGLEMAAMLDPLVIEDCYRT